MVVTPVVVGQPHSVIEKLDKLNTFLLPTTCTLVFKATRKFLLKLSEISSLCPQMCVVNSYQGPLCHNGFIAIIEPRYY